MSVERVGRKFLLSTGCVIMMVAVSALSAAFWGWNDHVNIDANDSGSAKKIIILCATFFYIAAYQIGFGPITWCMLSEIFPLEIRGKAIALGVELNYGLNFVVQLIFPTLQEKLGWGHTFFLFAVVLALTFFFIQSYVPETTGLTLEEIQAMLNDDDEPEIRNKLKQDQFLQIPFPSEETNLLGVRSSSFLGAHPSLEEMECQLIRTSSGGNF